MQRIYFQVAATLYYIVYKDKYMYVHTTSFNINLTSIPYKQLQTLLNNRILFFSSKLKLNIYKKIRKHKNKLLRNLIININ